MWTLQGPPGASIAGDKGEPGSSPYGDISRNPSPGRQGNHCFQYTQSS